MDTTFIYTLIDPETNEVRYVGKSNDPKKRLWRHLKRTRENEDCYRTRWINDLKSRNLKPSMEVIEEVSVDQWPERERYWIDHYRKQGCHLTNTFEGGLGTTTHTPETKAKISATRLLRGSGRGKKLPPRSEEWRQKISASKKGAKVSDETRAKQSQIRRGRKASDETRAKIAEANRGKKRPDVRPNLGKSPSAETRAKISASLKGHKQSPESIEKMAAQRRGVPRSAETKAKVSATKTGKKRGEFSEEWRANIGKAQVGRKHSPESLQKMSDARKRWHAARKAKQDQEGI